MTAVLTVGSLNYGHRARIEAIVRATGVFAQDEIGVALELFDEATAGTAHGKSDYELVGAFEDETLQGYACFGSTPSTDRTYDLYWIAVHPEAQRSGVGAALMDEVERQLFDRRGRLLVIETSSRDDYAPTRRFYARRGYQETARIRDFYASGDDRIVLTKRLGLH